MRALCAAFLKNESGATAIEYALIASGIAMAILAAIQSLGTSISSFFGNVSTALK